MLKHLIAETDLIQLQKEIQSIKEYLVKLQAESSCETYVDNEEAAKFLGVSKKTFQTYRNRCLIPYSQYGSKIWVKKKDLELFINSHLISKVA